MSGKEARSTDRLPDQACRRCRFYRVTWDRRFPYGCVAHGFKTHRNPAQVVYESSGLECQLFSPRGGQDV
ncbi:MAG: uracil-DNA glycosylase [Acidobacteria bacterium]|nr:uracil-DNA glycosylase [Acidobacteriota bacterium]